MLHGQPFVKEIGATTCNMRGKIFNKIKGCQQPLGLLRTRREREQPNSTQSSNDCDEIAASHCSPKAWEYADTG